MLRSMLFGPGDQPRKIEKALTELPADAIILDLEDAIAISAKPATRTPVAAVLSQPPVRSGNGQPATSEPGMATAAPDDPQHQRHPPRRFVRVNGVDTPWFFGDLDAVVVAGLDGVMLPKTPGAEAIYLADRYLAHLEHERGLPAGSIELLPLIESAAGVAAVPAMCRLRGQGVSRLQRLGFGATDYTVDVGATWTDGEDELLLVRTQMVLHSRINGLEPPIDTVYPHFRDHEGYAARCRRSKALGFGGRMCIHPDQIEPTNHIYLPAQEEIAWAEEVLAAFDEAESRGIGALQMRGQLIDYAFVARARQILRQAGRLTAGSGQ